MNKYGMLLPYWLFLFSIGFGWFIIAPLVPGLLNLFGTSLESVILLISLYGYTMVVLGLLSGYMSAKFSVRPTIIIAGILSIVGLFGRSFVTSYNEFIVFQVIAAAAYPLALAPVGSISSSIDKERSHTIVGASVGSLFLGMSFGSLLGPYVFNDFGLHSTLLIAAILGTVSVLLILSVIRRYPASYRGRSLRGSFEPSMIKNWYIGLVISALAVMFSTVASESLTNQGILNAVYLGGLFGGLSFLGSALGAMVLPPVFEKVGALKTGLVITSVLSLVSIFALAYFLAYFSLMYIAASGFFLFGFFGNSFWSMAMTSTTRYVSDPAQAGFATSMYSFFTNVGVAIIPPILGPFFLADPTIAISVVVLMVLVAFVISPTLRVAAGEEGQAVVDSY